jgi:hypothetical protein
MEGTKVQPKSDEQRAKDFVKEYEALCDKHQMRIVTNPVFVATNHNSFEVVLQTSVGKLPKAQ